MSFNISIFIYFCNYETIETCARAFFNVIIFSVGRVFSQNMQNQCKLCGIFRENLLIDTYDSIVKLSAKEMKYTFFCEAVIRFFKIKLWQLFHTKTGFIPTDSTAMNIAFLIALNKILKYIFSTSQIQYSICGLHLIVQNHSNQTG